MLHPLHDIPKTAAKETGTTQECNFQLSNLKTKDIFKLLALKVVAVAYERWPLARGSKYRDLTWKLLVFW